MKKLFFGVLVLAAVYAVSAYVLGGQVQDRYLSELKDYERYGIFSISNQKYERGLFSSRAETLVEIAIPAGFDNGEGEARNASFVVQHVFRHGPLPLTSQGFSFQPGLAAVESTLVASGAAQDELFAKIPELAQSRSDLRIGFSGDVTGDLKIPAFDLVVDDETLTWGGLGLHAAFTQADQSMRGDVTIPRLILKTGGGVAQLKDFSSKFDLVEAVPLVFAGRVEASLASMNMTQAAMDTISIKALRFSSNSTCDGVLLHYTQSVDIEGIEVGEAAHGPVNFEVVARNIDALAVSEFQTRFQQLYRSANDTDTDMFYSQAGELYGSLFSKLMRGTPEFSIPRLRVATSMGELTGALFVKLDAPGEEALSNPLLLIKHVDANVEMAVHETLLMGVMRMGIEQLLGAASAAEAGAVDVDALVRQQYAEQVEPLLARNLIVRDGETIRTRASFAQGKLVVNGQEMPLF